MQQFYSLLILFLRVQHYCIKPVSMRPYPHKPLKLSHLYYPFSMHSLFLKLILHKPFRPALHFLLKYSCLLLNMLKFLNLHSLYTPFLPCNINKRHHNMLKMPSLNAKLCRLHLPQHLHWLCLLVWTYSDFNMQEV